MLSNKYLIDSRTAKELQGEIAALAASYTPEWSFDIKNPDVGSVIGLIFANQMGENIKKLNLALEKYHTEFVNMLNLALLPAYPASGVVVMNLIEDTVPGVDVPKGTKLLGTPDGEDAGWIVFETVSDIHLTNSKLRDVISVSRHFGKIIPLLGDAKPAMRVPNGAVELPEENDEEEDQTIEPIALFDYEKEGIEQNVLLLYHKSVFDTMENASISVRFVDWEGQEVSARFADPKQYRWSYYTDDKSFAPFDAVTTKDGSVVLQKSEKTGKVSIEDEAYSLICVERRGVVEGPEDLQEIRLSSACSQTAPNYVSHNDAELEPEYFLPFGDTASIFDECYIGHDQVFSQQGALVTLRFRLSYQEKLVSFTPQEEEVNLKPIKRKPRTVLFDTANTSVQRVTLEYYNGMGWRRLVCTQDWSTVFEGEHVGDVAIRFVCPDDWAPVVIGGYFERAIRLRVIQADNCYLQPCIHKMPLLEQLTVAYSYYGEWKLPERVSRICGTETKDLTRAIWNKEPITAFSPLPYHENALYLGFDKKMSGAPVSILFDVEESIHFDSAPIRFEYSTVTGFHQLKVIDHTEHMTGVGTVLFMPPSDFAKREIEGQSRYWIKLVDADEAFDDPNRYHSVIRSILINAVEVQNVETLPEEQFYIDVATANMSFPLAADNILSAEVFVNEKNKLSMHAMRQMIEEDPDNVRVEYNFLGDISEFFVRWTEVDNFDHSKPTDRHYVIDRMRNTINFGDGVSVQIPSAQSGVAFTAQVSCCDGAAGNLKRGAINATFGNLLYVNSVENPIATYAGSNIESIESAHLRGANMLSSKGRLVSELDFMREVKAFSTSIDKVKCVRGMDLDGRRNDQLISIAVMMKDYEDGAYSFNGLKDRLRERILSKCEMTLETDQLIIAEPVYVELSVDVWVEVNSADNAFAIQNLLRDQISEFLEPLSKGGRNGWDIGVLPGEAQLRMMINSIQFEGRVRRFIATARYVDREGVHERDLSDLKGHPFMIGRNGTHRIHMILL